MPFCILNCRPTIPSTDCAWCNKEGWQCEQNAITGPDSKKGSRCQASEEMAKISNPPKIHKSTNKSAKLPMSRDKPEVLRVPARRLQAHRLLRPQCHLQEESQCEFIEFDFRNMPSCAVRMIQNIIILPPALCIAQYAMCMNFPPIQVGKFGQYWQCECNKGWSGE